MSAWGRGQTVEDTAASFTLVPCVVIPDASRSGRGSGRKKQGKRSGNNRRKSSGGDKSKAKAWRRRASQRPGDGKVDDNGDRRESLGEDVGDVAPPPAFEEETEPRPLTAVEEATARGLILEQLEHYFSIKNLCRDVFMRSYMDIEGWVPLPFVADFNCIQMVSTNLDLVRSCAAESEIVEWNEEHDKVRLKENWKTWLFPNPETGVYGLPLWLKNDDDDDAAEAEEPVEGAAVAEESASVAEEGAGAADKLSAAAAQDGGSSDAAAAEQASKKPLKLRASADAFVPGN